MDIYDRIDRAITFIERGAPRRMAAGASGITEEQLSDVISDGQADLSEGKFDTKSAQVYQSIYQAELDYYLDTLDGLPDNRGLDVLKARFGWVFSKPYDVEIEYGERRVDLSKITLGQIKDILADLQDDNDESVNEDTVLERETPNPS